MAGTPTTKAAIPAQSQLGPPVTLEDGQIALPAPKSWIATATPTPGAAYSFVGLGGQAMITVFVLPADAKADGLIDRVIKEARDKPNHNPAYAPKTPPTPDQDARFLARWHEAFTIRGTPSSAVHLYRAVGTRILHVQVGLLGNLADNAAGKKVVEIGEGMTLSAAETSAK